MQARAAVHASTGCRACKHGFPCMQARAAVHASTGCRACKHRLPCMQARAAMHASTGCRACKHGLPCMQARAAVHASTDCPHQFIIMHARTGRTAVSILRIISFSHRQLVVYSLEFEASFVGRISFQKPTHGLGKSCWERETSSAVVETPPPKLQISASDFRTLFF